MGNKLKELYDFIYKRKSVRQYKMEGLTLEALMEIEDFIKNIIPLHKEIRVHYKIVPETKNLLPVKAPHYLLIYSEEIVGYLINVGFMFQQLDLFLSSKGLGACWLGMAKPKDKIDDKNDFVIAIGFGEALNSPYRELSGFKRKPAEEVYKGTDERLEAARLAPSASNSQNWFFEEQDGAIHVYQKTINAFQNMLYGKMNQIDIGIALCYIYIAGLNRELKFEFITDTNHKDLIGFNYVGTVR
ncbi:MAG TPA: nitroreductase family protein [Clostridia bacterium]|nr:nitroreductase family protein [Clostridia bacterium]